MNRYTKKQYQADLAANAAATEKVNAEIARLHASFDAGTAAPADFDLCNAAYDLQHDLECQRRDIESRFARRNWTWQDHSHAGLVALNID